MLIYAWTMEFPWNMNPTLYKKEKIQKYGHTENEVPA